jgi:hypothetical protein
MRHSSEASDLRGRTPCAHRPAAALCPPTQPECRLQEKCFLSEGQAKSKQQYSTVQRKLITACILCFLFMIVEIVGGWMARRYAHGARSHTRGSLGGRPHAAGRAAAARRQQPSHCRWRFGLSAAHECALPDARRRAPAHPATAPGSPRPGLRLRCSIAIMSDAAHMLSDVSAFLVSIFAAWAATQPGTQLYSFGYHRAEILGALVSVLIIWLVTGALVFEAVQRTINPVRVDGKSEQAALRAARAAAAQWAWGPAAQQAAGRMQQAAGCNASSFRPCRP